MAPSSGSAPRPQPEPPTRGSSWSSLRDPGSQAFVGGQAVSQTGTWMQLVALAWLTLEITGSGTAVGVVAAATYGPVLLLTPWGGAIADRHNKVPLLLVCYVVAAVPAVCLGVLVLRGGITPALVVVLAVVHGCVYAFESPARRALVGELAHGPLW